MTMQAPVGARLKGQEISIRVLAGNPPEALATIDSISEFNDNTSFKLLEDGFLGEVVNRFDEVLDGYGGDFTMQVTNSGWVQFQQAIIDRATRVDPTIVFNVVRTDLFADGSSLVWVYTDAKWGEMPSKVGGRADFVKVSCNFKCSVRPVLVDQL
jgi:hypothetical protein